MLWVLSKIQRTVSRGFSALQPIFKNQGLISFCFLKKYCLILWKMEANCGRWVNAPELSLKWSPLL
jgi:hypothetical protein